MIDFFRKDASNVIRNGKEARDSYEKSVNVYEGKKKINMCDNRVQDSLLGDGWYLVWNDEFECSSYTDQYWNKLLEAPNKNKESEYYIPQNLKVENGYLTITTRKEPYSGRQYTSGAITTRNLFSFQYGRVDIRAKLPKGEPGIFPAFWMLPDSENQWLPEIDIMEFNGSEPHYLWGVVHWEENGKKKRDYVRYSIPENVSRDFHKYSLIWTSDQLTWLFDDKPVFSTKKYSPDIPMFLYVNTAVGGDWVGYPTKENQFPQYLVVDYVRVFKME